MTHKDINRAFTEQVSKLLAQGYQIHTNTMGGSQGQLASIDLYKDTDIIRVMLGSERDWSLLCYDIFTITVGRYTAAVRDTWHDIIWNDRLEIISEIKFSHIEGDYFVEPDAAKAMAAKKHERRFAREIRRAPLSDEYKTIALRYIKRQPKMKTCKLSEIERVSRCGSDRYGAGYEINARGMRFTICGKHI